jgi:hypothetical protein
MRIADVRTAAVTRTAPEMVTHIHIRFVVSHDTTSGQSFNPSCMRTTYVPQHLQSRSVRLHFITHEAKYQVLLTTILQGIANNAKVTPSAVGLLILALIVMMLAQIDYDYRHSHGHISQRFCQMKCSRLR